MTNRFVCIPVTYHAFRHLEFLDMEESIRQWVPGLRACTSEGLGNQANCTCAVSRLDSTRQASADSFLIYRGLPSGLDSTEKRLYFVEAGKPVYVTLGQIYCSETSSSLGSVFKNMFHLCWSWFKGLAFNVKFQFKKSIMDYIDTKAHWAHFRRGKCHIFRVITRDFRK